MVQIAHFCTLLLFVAKFSSIGQNGWMAVTGNLKFTESNPEGWHMARAAASWYSEVNDFIAGHGNPLKYK